MDVILRTQKLITLSNQQLRCYRKDLRTLKSVVSTILLLTLFLTGKAAACFCSRLPEDVTEFIEDRLTNADAVVLAKVEGVKPTKIESRWSDEEYWHNGEETHFSTIQSWKGSHAKHFYTKIITDCCMCGVRFREGEIILLFLHESEEKGYYETSSCAGNKLMDDAEKYIELLNRTPSLSKQSAMQEIK